MSLLADNRELLNHFRRGETRALEQIYRHYAPRIATFLSRGFTFKSRDRCLHFRGYHQAFDIDNALQETFARAFSERARLSYDGLRSYQVYLLAIARNLVLDEFRSREVAMSPFIELHEPVQSLCYGPARECSPNDTEAAAPAEEEYMQNELRKLYGDFVHELVYGSRSVSGEAVQCVHCHRNVGHGARG